MKEFDKRRFIISDGFIEPALASQFPDKTVLEPSIAHIRVNLADIYNNTSTEKQLSTQAMLGEKIEIYQEEENHYWCRLVKDGYVGFIDKFSITKTPVSDFKTITVPRAFAFAEPSIKTTDPVVLYAQSNIEIFEQDESFNTTTHGFIPNQYFEHNTENRDFTSFAGQYISAPYLWGGKTIDGLDCSALVQLALQSINIECPRDSDQQCEHFKEFSIEFENLAKIHFQRGDLLFWSGHVAICSAQNELLHANAHFMRTIKEPLDKALQRMEKQGYALKQVSRLPQDYLTS